MGQQGERESSRSLGPNTPDQGNSKIGVGVRGRAGRARCGMREVARSQPPRALRVMGSPWDFTPRENVGRFHVCRIWTTLAAVWESCPRQPGKQEERLGGCCRNPGGGKICIRQQRPQTSLSLTSTHSSLLQIT